MKRIRGYNKKAERNAQICRLYQNTLISQVGLARKYEVSHTRIRQILKSNNIIK